MKNVVAVKNSGNIVQARAGVLPAHFSFVFLLTMYNSLIRGFIMEQETQECVHHHPRGHRGYRRGGAACGGGAVYGMGFIGAIVYYFGTASSFWLFVFGFFKAIFWPAFLVFEALKFLHM